MVQKQALDQFISYFMLSVYKYNEIFMIL